MIIFGIDPGTRLSGYGIIRQEGSEWQALDYGCIRPPSRYSLQDRYLIIFESVDRLIEQFQPEALAVETQFVGVNIKSAIMLGMARGTVLVAAARKGVPVSEYSPATVKLAVSGSGRASKQQVQEMVKKLLRLSALPKPPDAADALALALCHAQQKDSYVQLHKRKTHSCRSLIRNH